MIALEYVRSIPRYAAARTLASARKTAGMVPHVTPLRLGHKAEPKLPTPEWQRIEPILSGICGSDLAMLTGYASFYFSPMVSMPFVPGHEVVGRAENGTRVVIEPVLNCTVRGATQCAPCAAGDTGNCERTWTGHGIAPGVQTGYCTDTSGGWSEQLVAHPSQIHTVPDDISDAAAVLIEPLACAIHAVLRANISERDTVLVAGAGTMGLLTIAAVKHLTRANRIIAVAKHPRQRAEAKRLGADEVATPDAASRAARAATHAMAVQPERGGTWLAGGVGKSFECSGRMDSLDVCLRSTKARGRVILVGLPNAGKLDLAPVWHRELEVVGAYAYGMEDTPEGPHKTFDIAIELAKMVDLEPLVSAVYPLSRWREAIDHALDAGRLDSIKVAFRP